MASDDGEVTPRRVPVLHGLPELVTRTLQKHYYAGVKEAEDRFEYNAAEEDSLTGDLGGCLTEPEPIAIRADGHSFLWQATVHKIRGGVPERRSAAMVPMEYFS